MSRKKKPAPPKKKQAIAGWFTPYADFTIKLRGYDIIERLTDKKLLKVAVWDRHKDNARMIESITNHTASSYSYIPHDRINKKTKKI